MIRIQGASREPESVHGLADQGDVELQRVEQDRELFRRTAGEDLPASPAQVAEGEVACPGSVTITACGATTLRSALPGDLEDQPDQGGPGIIGVEFGVRPPDVEEESSNRTDSGGQDSSTRR